MEMIYDHMTNNIHAKAQYGVFLHIMNNIHEKAFGAFLVCVGRPFGGTCSATARANGMQMCGLQGAAA